MNYKVTENNKVAISFTEKENEIVRNTVNEIKNKPDLFAEIPLKLVIAKFLANDPVIFDGKDTNEKKIYKLRKNKTSMDVVTFSTLDFQMPNKFQLLAAHWIHEAIRNAACLYDKYLYEVRQIRKIDEKFNWFNNTSMGISWSNFDYLCSRFRMNFDYDYHWRNDLSISYQDFNKLRLKEIGIEKTEDESDQDLGIFLSIVYQYMIKNEKTIYWVRENDIELVIRILRKNKIQFEKIERYVITYSITL